MKEISLKKQIGKKGEEMEERKLVKSALNFRRHQVGFCIESRTRSF